MNIDAKTNKKEVLKDIIRDLHRGGDVEELRKRFAELVRHVSGGEIASMEQELIAEGLPEEEIKKLCDVHVRVFKDSLEEQPASGVVPGHPLHTLSAENQGARKDRRPDAGQFWPCSGKTPGTCPGPPKGPRWPRSSTRLPRLRSTTSRKRTNSSRGSRRKAKADPRKSCGPSTTTSGRT